MTHSSEITPKAAMILGGSGFVGQHLVTVLQRTHPEIHVLTRKPPPYPEWKNVHYHCASFDDENLLDKLLPKTCIVFHLASESTPGSSALKPSFEAEQNIIPSLHLLEELQKHPHVQLVYLSTGGAIYGDPGHSLSTSSTIRENTTLMPLSYYGAGKAAVEKFIIAFCQQQQRSATILRPANFYGPGQTRQPGFGIIPTIFECLVQNQPLQIWGDGENVRDYLYIDDFIELCTIISTSPPLPGVRIYNVGSSQGCSLNKLCDLIEQTTHKPLRREYKPSRPIDVSHVVLDTNFIHNDFAWRAHTDLPTGLIKTWQWLSNTNQL